MSRPKSFVSKSEIAKELRLSKGRITQLIAQGLPVRTDGKLDREKAREWYEKNIRLTAKPERNDSPVLAPPAEPSEAADGEAGPEDFFASRARKERALADLRQMEAAQKRGDLLPTADVEAAWSEMVISARAILLGLPARLAQKMALETDRVNVEEILRDEIYRALSELSTHELDAS